MTDANHTLFSSAHFTATTPRPASRPMEPLTLTPDMINGLVVIGGSVVMALAGMGLAAWLALPFGA